MVVLQAELIIHNCFLNTKIDSKNKKKISCMAIYI